MLLIKFIQSLLKALNSEGTPGQVAAGIALGAALGLTPLLNLHNLVVVACAFLFTVSIPGVMLGWLAFTPLGFALDPLFDVVGVALLVDVAALQGLWTWMFNVPVLPLTNFNNTVVLGSILVWLAASIPIFFAARWAVTRYRATLYERMQRWPVFRAVKASKAYNVYRMFRP